MQTSLDFDITAAKHGGAPTSVAAHDGIKSAKRDLQAKVLGFVIARGEFGATVKEVRDGLAMNYTTASARLSELKALGNVEANGVRREGCAVLIAKYAEVE